MTETFQGRLSDHIERGLECFPGAVVIASVSARRDAKRFGKPEMEDGKLRPAVVKAEVQHGKHAGWWALWGLTGLSEYTNGTPRPPSAGVEKVGLRPSFCWGGNIVVVPPHDIKGVVWAAPLELLLACASAEQGATAEAAGHRAENLYRPLAEAGWFWPKHQPSAAG